MDITDIRLRLVPPGRSAKLKAFVSITLGHRFVIHDLKVIEGHKGLFVAMPSRKTGSGEFKDIAHPIDQAARDHLTRVVLEAYEAACATELAGDSPGR